MCGRYTIAFDEGKLKQRFDLEEIPFHLEERYNVAPGQIIPAIIDVGGKKRIGQLRWGLIPSWAKDEKMAYNMINAKAETIREKPAFRNLFVRKRCIIPADSFFEWKQLEKGKQPMRIMMTNGDIFSFAALYDTWVAPNGDKISTCTILTTKANDTIKEIHERMPVILQKKDEEIWLDRERHDADLLQSLLVPYDAGEMKAYPVSAMVGNAKNDLPECINEIAW